MLTALAMAAAVGGWLRLSEKNPVPPGRSIAVLPFADLSPEKDQAYFSDGVTEDLRNMLAAIPGLRVSGNSSSNRFRNTTEDVVSIGKKLNVRVILEGAVRKIGDRVRFAVQLFNAANGAQLWSNSFDLNVGDVLSAQEEIARVLAREMKITLLANWTDSYPKSVNGDAYAAYLQGRYSLRRNKEMLERAVGNFELAIKLDPRYAPAWDGLGAARVTQAESGYIPAEKGLRDGRDALAHALVLDPNLSDAQMDMGDIKLRLDWNWTSADGLFRRVLAKAPGNPKAIRLAAQLAATLGHFDEAIQYYRDAIQIDPLRAATYTNLAIVLYYAGRLPEARVAAEKAIEMEPRLDAAHFNLSRVCLLQSHPQEALQEAQREANPTFRLEGLALAHYALGAKADSDTALSDLVTRYSAEGPFNIAEVYAFRGEADRAMEWLNRAYDSHDSGLTDLKGDPVFKSLLGDPRYTLLLTKLHLPL